MLYRLLRGANERRFESKLLPVARKKRRKKVVVQKFSDFPKPVWRKKKKRSVCVPTGIKKEEE